eukprot:COSAG02_NODE_59952_length_272_cov_1.491329_2_plen_31_part_01
MQTFVIVGEYYRYMFGSAIANDFKWLGQHGL